MPRETSWRQKSNAQIIEISARFKLIGKKSMSCLMLLSISYSEAWAISLLGLPALWLCMTGSPLPPFMQMAYGRGWLDTNLWSWDPPFPLPPLFRYRTAGRGGIAIGKSKIGRHVSGLIKWAWQLFHEHSRGRARPHVLSLYTRTL